MKHAGCTLLLVALLGLGTQCKKDKTDAEQLPPLTMTGERTFGCLIDGKIFLPKKQGLNSSQQCYYQHIYPGDQGYVFLIKGNHEDGCDTRSVTVYLDSVKLAIGHTYALTVEDTASNNGIYFIGTCNSFEKIVTDNDNTGQLTITHLDETNNIVSGTFSFTVTSKNGTTYKITEGRFDQPYNR